MSRRNEAYVPLLCNYPDSEKINRVSEGAEAMFCRLLAKCDDEGNYHGEPKRLLGKLFTLRYENGTMDVRKVKKYISELIKMGLIICYEIGAVRYVHVNNCKKSLRKDVKKKLFFPEFSEQPQSLFPPEDTESVTGRPESVPSIQTNPNQSKPIQTKAFMDYWNKKEHLPKIISMNSSRTESLRTRAKEPLFYESWKKIIDLLDNSLFHTGRKEGCKWRATVDWILKNDNNYGKILELEQQDEGNGVDKKSQAAANKVRESMGLKTY